MRSSILVQNGSFSMVVDTGPEFRLQALRAGLGHLDAVLYTHNHADHMNGIDDLRVFCETCSLPVYGPEQVLSDIQGRFPYAVGDNPWKGGIPQLVLRSVPASGFYLGDLHILPIPLVHGCRHVYGYRIGDFAYLTDCKEIPDQSMQLLGGLDTVVLDALRIVEHPTHMSLQEAVAAARAIGASNTWFTHMSHRISHREVDASLPDRMHLAYDGLVLCID